MKLQLRVRPVFERPDEDKRLSGAENQFELWLLFVEKLDFGNMLPIFLSIFFTSRCTVEVKLISILCFQLIYVPLFLIAVQTRLLILNCVNVGLIKLCSFELFIFHLGQVFQKQIQRVI